MDINAERPRVFLDVSIGTEPAGRLVLVLFTDKAPKTCENFRALCAGTSKGLTYKLSPFHRIIDEFMIQGGDITKGDGTGGISIYGDEFEDENIGWRQIDEAGLVCMANRGRDTNSSQFFITLAPCEHLNAKHTVFGQLVSGQDALDRIAKVKVDKNDRPLTDVFVSHCGELQKQSKKKRGAIDVVEDEDGSKPSLSRQSTTSRGRHKRRHIESQSRSRSRSPSRGHTRRSASRHRHNHRHRRQRTDVHPNDTGTDTRSSRSHTPMDTDYRRRSDAQIDHTKRGRQRQRSRSRSPRKPDDIGAHYQRKRSPEPSRPRSKSPAHRNSRSLPNQYKSQQQRTQRQQGNGSKWTGRGGYPNDHYEDEEDRLARMEWERDGGDRRRFRYDDQQQSAGRLGRLDDFDGGHEQSNDGIVYKGRGTMKFREHQQR